MKWMIDDKKCIGLNLTNDGAREYTFGVVVSYGKYDKIVHETTTLENALRVMQNTKNEIREQMVKSPSMNSRLVRVVKTKKKGTQVSDDHIRWNDITYSTKRVSNIVRSQLPRTKVRRKRA